MDNEEVTAEMNQSNINEVLYAVKLTSGEELMAVLVDITEEGIEIEDPILVSKYPVMTGSGISEAVVMSAWMALSSTSNFFLDSMNVMTIQPLHPDLYATYLEKIGFKDKPFFVDTSESIH
jgi:hypothetical protein